MRPSRTAPARKIDPATSTSGACVERQIDRALGVRLRRHVGRASGPQMTREIVGRNGARRGSRRRDHRRHVRQQRADDLLHVLVAHDANDERWTFRVPSLQIGRQRPCAFRIVRRVEQDLTTLVELNQLEPRRPLRVRETLLDRAARDSHAPLRGRLEQAHGDDRVLCLMRATKPQRHRTICRLRRLDGHARAPAGHLRGAVGVDGAFDQRRRRARRPTRAMTSRASGHQCAEHDGHAGLDDARLLEGNRLERVAEMLLMIEVDGGDGARNRRDRRLSRRTGRRARPRSRQPRSSARRNSSNADRRRGLEERRLHRSGHRSARSRSAQASTSSTTASRAAVSTGRSSMTNRSLRSLRWGEV